MAQEGPEKELSGSSRFSDNPFRDPNATPEQIAWLENRNKNMRLYRQTGDQKYLDAAFQRPPKKDALDSDADTGEISEEGR